MIFPSGCLVYQERTNSHKKTVMIIILIYAVTKCIACYITKDASYWFYLVLVTRPQCSTSLDTAYSCHNALWLFLLA